MVVAMSHLSHHSQLNETVMEARQLMGAKSGVDGSRAELHITESCEQNY